MEVFIASYDSQQDKHVLNEIIKNLDRSGQLNNFNHQLMYDTSSTSNHTDITYGDSRATRLADKLSRDISGALFKQRKLSTDNTLVHKFLYIMAKCSKKKLNLSTNMSHLFEFMFLQNDDLKKQLFIKNSLGDTPLLTYLKNTERVAPLEDYDFNNVALNLSHAQVNLKQAIDPEYDPLSNPDNWENLLKQACTQNKRFKNKLTAGHYINLVKTLDNLSDF
jgi:hypothetical protein